MSGSNGLDASLWLHASRMVVGEADEIAVKNRSVAPESPQSMGLLDVVGLRSPRTVVLFFSTRIFAPSNWMAWRVRFVSSHCKAPLMTDSPGDSREAKSAR